MRVLIVGAGGHGQVVADILLRVQEEFGHLVPVGYVDDDPALAGQSFLGLPVRGSIQDIAGIDCEALIISLGDNRERERLYGKLRDLGARFAVACHPRAVIAPDAAIGPGSVICAGAVVSTGVSISANVIVNTGSTVDHHCRLGEYVHVAPGVHLGGNVEIGGGSLIGIGATVMPGKHIGEWCVVGAGALVTDDLAANMTVAGNPARPLIGKRDSQ